MDDSAFLLTALAVGGLVGLNALSYYCSRKMVLPEIIWVLLAGLGYGALANFTELGIPDFKLTPKLVLSLFVPLLIFASTRKTCVTHFKNVLIPASLAATLGILISMTIFGAALHFGFDLGWTEALLFGAIMSATDPLAVGALLQNNTKVTESQKLMVEGESIFNDGFVVTVAGLLSALVFSGEELMLGSSILHFLIHVAGALALGLILGRGARWLLRIWDEEHFTLTVNITLALAFGSYAFSEALGLSGILAVFASAVAFGYKPDLEEHNQHITAHVWEYLEYLANSVLFFLLGASFFSFASFASLSVLIVVAGIALLFLSRFSALLVLSPLMKIDGEKMTRENFWLLNFSGARGAVSVALILLLPDDFELKPLFLSLAFIMIIFSLVVYPIAISRLLKEEK